MTVPPLLVLGNANVDLVMGEVQGWPQVGTEVVVPRSEMRPGGSAGNTALALTGMSIPHRFIATVGDDVLGRWLTEGFDQASTDWIVMPCATTITVGIVHQGGDRAFFTAPGHLQQARLEDLLERIPAAPGPSSLAIVSGGFLMPRIAAGTRDLLLRLNERGWCTAIDPGWPPEGWTEKAKNLCRGWLHSADLALLNAEEVRGLSGVEDLEAAEGVLAGTLRASQTLVVKRGADGARAVCAGRRFRATTPAVEVIDTVGAGDTFNAAFLAELVGSGSLEDALQAGVFAASLAISTFPRRYVA